MKTDNDYIYPETAEELAMFYGWEFEVESKYGDVVEWEKEIDPAIMFEDIGDLDFIGGGIRFKLPTISDLKVGDVVMVKGGKDETIYINHETKLNWIVKAVAQMRPVSLLIGRNTWIPVKCN